MIILILIFILITLLSFLLINYSLSFCAFSTVHSQYLRSLCRHSCRHAACVMRHVRGRKIVDILVNCLSSPSEILRYALPRLLYIRIYFSSSIILFLHSPLLYPAPPPTFLVYWYSFFFLHLFHFILLFLLFFLSRISSLRVLVLLAIHVDRRWHEKDRRILFHQESILLIVDMFLSRRDLLSLLILRLLDSSSLIRKLSAQTLLSLSSHVVIQRPSLPLSASDSSLPDVFSYLLDEADILSHAVLAFRRLLPNLLSLEDFFELKDKSSGAAHEACVNINCLYLLLNIFHSLSQSRDYAYYELVERYASWLVFIS